MKTFAFLLLLTVSASAEVMQSDCRGPGSIGTALMSADGTITLTISTPGQQGALAYHRGDPQYARILSHVGGLHPGERKPVPPFC
ncbi:MAG TPA: hypothetical protein VNU69_00820 [Rhizomicrobium sp.]|nr:hypothetical protein [Rhizomicrobium sp.]